MQGDANPPGDSLGIYVSVHFCRAKGSCCNFASGVRSPEAIERYVALLCGEIRTVRNAGARVDLHVPDRVDTIYLGGGTPSLLEPQQMRDIFAAVRDEFAIEAGAEITLEAAPGQIDDRLLEAALACGVNRVSLGVQSLVDREAQAVGRSHTEASCRAEFARLRAAGVPYLGADLIAGLPYQTAESWARSLDVALGCELDHLSVYMLEVDEESRLGREVLSGGARLHAPAVPSDDLMAELYEAACRRLPQGGFAQYEISNFARPGRQSRHNVKYWRREPYLGFGLDAHSMLLDGAHDALRFANAENLEDYDGMPSVDAADAVSRREAFEETVFLGLRLYEGLPWAALKAFPADWGEEFSAAVEELRGSGLLGADRERLWLTERGKVVSSGVFGELLAATPA